MPLALHDQVARQIANISHDTHPAVMAPNHDDNVPNRFELHLLGEGEKKVTWQEVTNVPHTCIFTFNKEDHTLGNLLSQKLHKYPFVKFSAYKVPHPLFATFDLRLTTDGSVSPRDALIQSCRDVVNELEILAREFTKEMELKKIAKAGGEA